MANPSRGEAGVSLRDGRELTLAFDFDALCAAEDAANKSIGEMLLEMAKGAPRLSTARALLYGGLQRHHADMTLTDAGELILSDGPALSAAVEKAIAAAFPNQAEGKDSTRPRKARRGIGSPS